MARIVCQVLHRSQRISFLWSENAASFEPYSLEGSERDHFLSLARQINQLLPQPSAGLELSQRGHQFYRALFRMDQNDAVAQSVHRWFSQLAQEQRVDTLEFLCDVPACFSWNTLIEEVPTPENLQTDGGGWQNFFGARFKLGCGRRVNALRAFPVLAGSTHALAVDPQLVEPISEAVQVRLKSFVDAGPLLSTTEALEDELKVAAPDFLLLLVRFEQGQVFLGERTLDLQTLRDWFQESNDPNPEPVLLLMGNGKESDQAAWQSFLSEATTIFSGLVANEVFYSAEALVDMGTSILQRLIQSPQEIGEELRSWRAARGMNGLAFSAYLPPELKILQQEMESPMNMSARLPLPDAPYFPFAAYEAADRPLFFGRDQETITCSALLDRSSTRGVFLHGAPAGGKTSFLQAGLIPSLEQESVGFRVLRDRTTLDTPLAEIDYPILILRCSHDLLGQIADALTVFCAQPLSYTTPLGTTITVDLPNILDTAVRGPLHSSTRNTDIEPAHSPQSIPRTEERATAEDPTEQQEGLSARDLWIALNERSALLAQVLEVLTRSLPFELVIVIDQGEELLTLVHTPQRKKRRQKALDALLHLSTISSYCKLIFTLQSQYLGQLLSLLPGGDMPGNWRSYFLTMLSEEKMVGVLLWPTNQESIPYTDEVPFQKYGFSYEDDLAQKIVADAKQLAESEQQSPLAILQAVGGLLHEKQVQGLQHQLLRLQDLKDLGGVNQALTNALDLKLQRIPLKTSSRDVLRSLLGSMSQPQPDGTVSRDLILASDLKKYVERQPAQPIEEIVTLAAEQEHLIEIQQLLIGGKQEIYISLPQDSLARLGKTIAADKKVQSHARRKVSDVLWIMIPMVFFAAALSFCLTSHFGGKGTKKETTSAAEDKSERAGELGELRGKIMARQSLYQGLVAQADLALQAGNALRARQLLVSQPAMRSFDENKEKVRLPDLRGFEWRYLWKYLNAERFLLERHRSLVTSVAVSPDSLWAASASHDGMIHLWNLKNGEILASLGEEAKVPSVPIHCIAFSPDGKTLASAAADHLIRLWDLSQIKSDYVKIVRESKALQGHTDEVLVVAYGKDRQTLASAGADKQVLVWDLVTGKSKHQFKEHKAVVAALAFAEEGKTLVSGDAEGTLLFWDVEEGKKLQAIKTPYRSISTLVCSADGKTLASGGTESETAAETGLIRFWTVKTAKETLNPIRYAAAIFALAFQPDGKAIAAAGKDQMVRLFEVDKGQEIQRWIGHLGWVRTVAFAGDSSALLSGGYDQTVKIWNPQQSSGPDVIRTDDNLNQCLALNRKNTLLASGTGDGTVRLWDTHSATQLLNLPAHKKGVTALTFSNHLDKTILAVGTRDEKGEGEIRIWQIESDGKQGYQFKERHTLKGTRGITALAFHPLPTRADILIAASVDRSVTVWNTDSAEQKGTYTAHKEEIRCVAFTPDGNSFASAGKDRTVYLYQLDKKGHTPLANLHQGSIESMILFNFPVRGDEGRDRLAGLMTAGTDQTLRIWAYGMIEGGQLMQNELRVFRSHTQPITGIAYSEEGLGLIATSSWDRSIKLYDLFHERFTLLGHLGPVRALVLAADQSFLASAGHDGTIRIWRAPLERPAPKVRDKE